MRKDAWNYVGVIRETEGHEISYGAVDLWKTNLSGVHIFNLYYTFFYEKVNYKESSVQLLKS